MTRGLVKLNVFVIVTFKYEFVEFRRTQKFPACEVVTDDGNVNELNELLVK